MKAFLAPGIRKSVPKIAFTFSKSDFLGLNNFEFLDLAKFATVDRFLILLSTPSFLSTPPLVPLPLALAAIS